MRKNGLLIAGLALCAAGLLLTGCGKAQKEAPPSPHSIDGIMEALHTHARLLDDAAKRKDFKYVHDHAYYMKNLAQSLFSQMDDRQKAEAKAQMTELLKVVDRLDATSGRRQEQPTLAGTQFLQETLKELDAKLRPDKNPS
jgi:hypothetical protein